MLLFQTLKQISRNLFHLKLHIFCINGGRGGGGGGVNRKGALISSPNKGRLIREGGLLERGAFLEMGLNRENTIMVYIYHLSEKQLERMHTNLGV